MPTSEHLSILTLIRDTIVYATTSELGVHAAGETFDHETSLPRNASHRCDGWRTAPTCRASGHQRGRMQLSSYCVLSGPRGQRVRFCATSAHVGGRLGCHAFAPKAGSTASLPRCDQAALHQCRDLLAARCVRKRTVETRGRPSQRPDCFAGMWVTAASRSLQLPLVLHPMACLDGVAVTRALATAAHY